MYLILYVLNDIEKLSDLLDAWESTGVGGVTILPSTGLGRIRTHFGLRDDLPVLPSLDALINQEEVLNRTLFTVVKEDLMVDKVLKKTEDVVGSLDEPEHGILIVIPLARAYGVRERG